MSIHLKYMLRNLIILIDLNGIDYYDRSYNFPKL